MSEATPTTPTTNKIGLAKSDYSGSPSTLCTGCGHDQITGHLITACYQLGIDPYNVIKTSGIGCSSKTPAYYLNKSFGFNSLHGRMAPVTTGAQLANPNFTFIGMSGDGDSASIGIGGFVHAVRKNVKMVYIIANNGVYGLTKGQFSPTADRGASLKTGEKNPFETLDLCSLALDLGCGFVARTFSGDAKQIVPLLKSALSYNGTAVIDVISPCVTFNNHDGSTKSFSYVKEHDHILQELGYVPSGESITVDYAEGSTEVISLHDGSKITLKKLNSETHNVHDRLEAMKAIYDSRGKGEILTGVLFIEPEKKTLVEELGLSKTPLSQLTEKELRGSKELFSQIIKEFA